MAGGVLPGQRRAVRLQLRATAGAAPRGQTYWSAPVALDALGGAAVVPVACPIVPTAGAHGYPRAAYLLSLTATRVWPCTLSVDNLLPTIHVPCDNCFKCLEHKPYARSCKASSPSFFEHGLVAIKVVFWPSDSTDIADICS